ncbi:hypothetical protein HGO38_21635 [Rhizobium sp. CG5]|nr:hypothetical protein [Rhizobium sp. CG5]
MRRLYAALGLSLIAFVPISVTAADLVMPTCACNVTDESEGLVRTVLGTVFVSRETGLAPAHAETRFSLPGRVLVGPRSSSTVEIGAGCRISIAANQSLEIDKDSGNWCVQVVDGQVAPVAAPATAAAAATGTATAGVIAPIAVGGLALGAVVISIAREDDRVSR